MEEKKVKEMLQEICDWIDCELSCRNIYECNDKCTVRLLAKELGINMKFIDKEKENDN